MSAIHLRIDRLAGSPQKSLLAAAGLKRRAHRGLEGYQAGTARQLKARFRINELKQTF
jgi:hypothetical protein